MACHHSQCWMVPLFSTKYGGHIVIRIYDKKQLYFHLFESWIKTIYLFQLTELKRRLWQRKKSWCSRIRLRYHCRHCAISSTQFSNLLQFFSFCFSCIFFVFFCVVFMRQFKRRLYILYVRISCNIYKNFSERVKKRIPLHIHAYIQIFLCMSCKTEENMNERREKNAA